MQTIEINNIQALFTDERVKEVPNGKHKYEVRHNEEGEPATIEQRVLVDFYGTILTDEPIEMLNDDYTIITSFAFSEE